MGEYLLLPHQEFHVHWKAKAINRRASTDGLYLSPLPGDASVCWVSDTRTVTPSVYVQVTSQQKVNLGKDALLFRDLLRTGVYPLCLKWEKHFHFWIVVKF